MRRTTLVVAALAAACAAPSPRPAEERNVHAAPAPTPVLLEIAAGIRSLAAGHPPLARFEADAVVTEAGIFYMFRCAVPPRPDVPDELLRRPRVALPLDGGILIWIRWLPDEAMSPQDALTAVGRLKDGRRYAVDLRVLHREFPELEERLWRLLQDHGWTGSAGRRCPSG